MPWAPKRPCPCGCGTLLTPSQRRCAESARAYDQARGSERQKYSTPAWRQFRARVLRDRPLCEECGTRPSHEVAHVLPWRQRPDLAFVMANVRALCPPCHRRESAVRGERWGGGR
jgi:5-methylcytosine-specific restriction protein A